jgi:uncharacterized membrane protein
VVGQLQSEGAIALQPYSEPASFLGFLFDPDHSLWVYAILVASASEVALVIENVQSVPLWLLRFILGLGLLGFFPGYCTVQVLFPGSRLPVLEQALLSIFLSVMISIALGVVLGVPYDFTGTSSVLALTVYVLVSAVIANYRQYETAPSAKGNSSQ